MITADAAAIEARYGNKTAGAAIEVPIQELYAPGQGQKPNAQARIAQGVPVPEGKVIQQVVGRGQPSMAVVPPKKDQPNQPQIAVVPPQSSGRTTIGTFVERPGGKVSPTKSNPLSATEPVAEAEPAISAISPAEPAKTQAKPKRPPLDLAKEILTHIWELGEEAATFYDRSPDTFKRWQQNPAVIPLQAVNKFLSRKPELRIMIQEQLEPHFSANGDGDFTSYPNRGKKDVFLCLPVLERPTLPFTIAFGWLNKKYELGWSFQADTLVPRSRNMLVHRFLESKATWSLWIDCDMAPPINHADWYRSVTVCHAIPQEFCEYDSLERFLSHGKPIVGGVYASRRWQGRLIIQPEIHPRGHEDKLLCNDIRKGTARGLVAVDWVGFGLAIVHREVFIELKRAFPQLAPTQEYAPWRFFQPEGDEGEDEAFCKRCRACSIPIWLDTQLIAGHIGSMAFLPEHTLGQAAV